MSKSIHKLYKAIEIMRQRLNNSDVQAPMMLVLLDIASRKTTAFTELQNTVGVKQGTVSRIVAKLGCGMPGESGLNLVVAYEDPDYRRQKVVELTPAGKAVIEEIEAALAE